MKIVHCITLLGSLVASSSSALSAQVGDPCTDVTLGLMVTVSPQHAQISDVITVTVQNVSSCLMALPTPCPIYWVSKDDCDGPVVMSWGCIQVTQFIGPGGSISGTWTPALESEIGPVQPGSYYLHLTGLSLCPTVEIVPGPSPATNYGTGDVGSGGFVPELGTNGKIPHVGATDFQLSVNSGLGGAPALLFVGTAQAQIQYGWGTLLVHPMSLVLTATLQLGGLPSVPGAGSLSLPVRIPNEPTLVGQAFELQVLIADPSSSGGISGTEALALTIWP